MNRTYSHESPSVLDVRDPYSQFYQGPHHGKHWYLWHPNDIGTAKPMNENEWFKAFQPLLLRVINTGYGRQLMGINPVLPPIQLITKNAIRYYLGEGQWQSEFHTGAKWANVIRYRWPEFKRYARFFYDMPNFFTMLNINGLAVAAHATSTFYPDPNPETTTVDGYVRREGGYDDWDDDRDVEPGEGANDTDNGIGLANLVNWRDLTGSGSNSVWYIYRNYFLFDTSGITDTDVVSAAVITFEGDYTLYDQGSDITLSGGALISNTAVATGDYDGYLALNSPTEFASRFDITGWDNAGDNDITFNAAGRAAVNLTGVTTILERGSQDVIGTEPAWQNSRSQAFTFSANRTGTSQDPKLVVTHAPPAVDFKAMNGIDLDDIEKVNGITAANAEKINTIDF